MTNLAHIKAWHDALVSGDYEQTTGTLYRNGGYCCLGVACMVAKLDGIQVERHEPAEVTPLEPAYGMRLPTDDGGYYVETDVLPVPVQDWLGIRDRDPELLFTDGGYRSASNLNDERHFTFDQIAECIRLTWPEAFTSTNEEPDHA